MKAVNASSIMTIQAPEKTVSRVPLFFVFTLFYPYTVERPY